MVATIGGSACCAIRLKRVNVMGWPHLETGASCRVLGNCIIATLLVVHCNSQYAFVFYKAYVICVRSNCNAAKFNQTAQEASDHT